MTCLEITLDNKITWIPIIKRANFAYLALKIISIINKQQETKDKHKKLYCTL